MESAITMLSEIANHLSETIGALDVSLKSNDFQDLNYEIIEYMEDLKGIKSDFFRQLIIMIQSQLDCEE